MNELYHYGVKGMKWGVRKTKKTAKTQKGSTDKTKAQKQKVIKNKTKKKTLMTKINDFFNSEGFESVSKISESINNTASYYRINRTYAQAMLDSKSYSDLLNNYKDLQRINKALL